ncbi:hypothetical protein ABC304_10880 [Microbacterium sp. 1P10UB]|uniref:hypothetical protein n=1 Tax=unclassified Microbacterium TaxID=2609290 RepID=UPI0039A2FFEA
MNAEDSAAHAQAGDAQAAEPQHPAASHDHPHRKGFAHWFDRRFRSAVSIYGLVVYAALITINTDHADAVWDILWPAFRTLVVFFIAHTFAHTLTDHGERGLWKATRHAMRHASGMLYAAVPASLVLLIAVFEEASVDDAFRAAIWTTTIVLGLLGYFAYGRRGASVIVRVLGGVGTALLGLIIVLLEYAFH